MTNKKYKWRFQPKGNVKAQVAGECIEKIEKENKGRVTAKMLLFKAKAQRHPLHSCFEWDNSVAGRKYREQQAQNIIIQITVVQENPNSDAPYRAFVSVTEDDSTHYTTIGRAMGRADLRRQIIEQALSELNAFRHKYSDLKELAEVFTAIVKVDKKLNGKKTPQGWMK